MRAKGWSEEEIAELILPYMPPPRSGGESRAAAEPRPAAEARAPAERRVVVPAGVSMAWLDEHLPATDRQAIGLVVEELERRGWSSSDVALAVLPHLLPKLPPEDRDAILAGLKELGMTDAEIARLAPGR